MTKYATTATTDMEAITISMRLLPSIPSVPSENPSVWLDPDEELEGVVVEPPVIVGMIVGLGGVDAA